MPTDTHNRQAFRLRLLGRAAALAEEFGIDQYAIELKIDDDAEVVVNPPGPNPFADLPPVPVDDADARYLVTIETESEERAAWLLAELSAYKAVAGRKLEAIRAEPERVLDLKTIDESALWRTAVVAVYQGGIDHEASDAVANADELVMAYRARHAWQHSARPQDF